MKFILCRYGIPNDIKPSGYIDKVKSSCISARSFMVEKVRGIFKDLVVVSLTITTGWDKFSARRTAATRSRLALVYMLVTSPY